MLLGTTLEACSVAGYLLSALYENFWPATEASYIRPPFVTLNTAIPLCYTPCVVASSLPPLWPVDDPVVPVEADAPAVIATAPTPAPNSKLPLVNSSNARLSSKKTTWLYACPPA